MFGRCAPTVPNLVVMSKAQPILELRDVSKTYLNPQGGKAIAVLSHFNLVITRGETGQVVVLFGPSGCGKTTILNLLSGMLEADDGQVLDHGQVLLGPNTHSATVPQAYTCFPWLTALGNVEFGLAVRGMERAKRHRIAAEQLEKVGLGDRRSSYPKQLSGGMQQRVAIARALAIQPQVLLMDEPFGALDAQTRADMQQLLAQTVDSERALVVFVTHDATEALLLADRIIVLSARPARIICDMKVLFEHPRQQSVALAHEFVKMREELIGLLANS